MRIDLTARVTLKFTRTSPRPGQRGPNPCGASKVARRYSLFSLALLLSLCFAASAYAEKVAQLNPRGYVNDFAGVIDSETNARITAICTEVDQKAHAQISVVTVKTLEGLEASVFGNELYKKWGIGYKGENRGALILLATDDHKYWNEIGYGLEPILPDGKVGGFGREMVPSLRSGDYSGGLLRITAQIADVIATDRGVKLDSLTNGQLLMPQRQERQNSRQNEQNSNADEHDKRRGSMTPEERRALRQQIQDAGRDVYPPGR